MKMVANETELRNALKEKAPEITIVTSYADTVKKKYGLDLKAYVYDKKIYTCCHGTRKIKDELMAENFAAFLDLID